MRVSIFSDYALHVLMHAASGRTELTTIDEVASGYDISRNGLSKGLKLFSWQRFLLTRTEIDRTAGTNERCAILAACRFKDVLGEAARASYNILNQATLRNPFKREDRR